MGMHVRLATREDANDLSILNHEFNGGTRRAVSDVSKSLTNSNELVVLAILNDTVAGFACAQSFSTFCDPEPQGEITEVYVRETARRQGAASAMISLLEENLHDRGVRSVKVLTGKTNDGAVKTYQVSGYQIEDEVMLSKEL